MYDVAGGGGGGEEPAEERYVRSPVAAVTGS